MLYTAVDKPSISRLDLSAIASNTGCTSDGEQAITLRMSAVAVCRSSASLVSLNSRVFSIAIRAWSRKDSASAISLSPNMLACFPITASKPMHSPPRSSGMYSAELVP